MNEQVFVDGVGTISVIGGTVRVDLVAYSPTEKDASGQPLAVFRQRLIFGMEGFLHAAEKIHEAAQTLSSRAPRNEPVALTPVQSVPRPPVEPQTEGTPQTPAKPPFP